MQNTLNKLEKDIDLVMQAISNKLKDDIEIKSKNLTRKLNSSFMLFASFGIFACVMLSLIPNDMISLYAGKRFTSKLDKFLVSLILFKFINVFNKFILVETF